MLSTKQRLFIFESYKDQKHLDFKKCEELGLKPALVRTIMADIDSILTENPENVLNRLKG